MRLKYNKRLKRHVIHSKRQEHEKARAKPRPNTIHLGGNKTTTTTRSGTS